MGGLVAMREKHCSHNSLTKGIGSPGNYIQSCSYTVGWSGFIYIFCDFRKWKHYCRLVCEFNSKKSANFTSKDSRQKENLGNRYFLNFILGPQNGQNCF